MLLAAETKDRKQVEVLTTDCVPGTNISIEGATPSAKTINIEDFLKNQIVIKNNTAYFMDKQLLGNNKFIKTEKIPEGKVK
jgi:hypothetical protein